MNLGNNGLEKCFCMHNYKYANKILDGLDACCVFSMRSFPLGKQKLKKVSHLETKIKFGNFLFLSLLEHAIGTPIYAMQFSI